ncbi:MAG TPA: sensor histidine kinase [Lacunisphaera sp.]|nr:sensor histidine kinase [Lacunisphaera sp.]
MPPLAERRPATIALILGAIMSLVFVGLVLRYDHDLRAAIHEKMIRRDAAVLTSVAQQEIESAGLAPDRTNAGRWLAALLPAAHREGLLAMAIFDADGVVLEKIPSGQLLVELPPGDFVSLQDGRPITRFWPAFSLATILPGSSTAPTPVLEVVLPLHGRAASAGAPAPEPIGFVRYDLDARRLQTELAELDAGVRRQTLVTLTVGLAALGLLVGAAYALLGRAQRTIAERTARLQRANAELTLAAKTSALGQITSHLVHGLQGSVAGLRSVVAAPTGLTESDSKAAAGYAEQMQAIIQEIVALLGDRSTGTTYELTGRELAELIRRRNTASAADRNVTFGVDEGFAETVDNHRGGLLCLIVSNLVQNAIAAAGPAGRVRVALKRDATEVRLLVSDNGPGIPREVRDHLFEPGRTGRAGGTGLGLVISQLLARQIGAEVRLMATGPEGTTFGVRLPLEGGPA